MNGTSTVVEEKRSASGAGSTHLKVPRMESPGKGAGATIASSSGERLLCLDAYRGLIMFTLLAGGIFHSLKGVPGWDWLFQQNEHVAWEGCVYWDLIQPSFMFMVGVAMPFAFARRAQLGEGWGEQLKHAAIRALNLILIGVLLDHIGSERIQIGFIRVLQQIAFGYFAAFFLVGRGLAAPGLAAGAILLGYHLVWVFNPWNGPGGPWAMGNENLGSVVDRWMLGRNYSGYYVGLNAVPSTATILFGVMAGEWIRRRETPYRTMVGLGVAGLGAVLLGWVLSPWAPLIKRIWTPSFAVFAGGWTTLMLLFFYWSIEVMGWRRWSMPLVVVGVNSIAAYVIGNGFGGWMRSFTGAWISWLKPELGPVWFPVFQRVVILGLAWGVLYVLYRRKIFFKA